MCWIDVSICHDINIPNVCVRRKTKRVLYGYGAGTQQRRTPKIFLNWLCFPKTTIRWINLQNKYNKKYRIGNVLNSADRVFCFHCVSVQLPCGCVYRRLVYGAKIYTYPPTHTHTQHTKTHRRAYIYNTYIRRIHCKCRKFLLLSFVALFVCIAPS